MPIVPATNDLMDQAETIVRSVFGWMSLTERLSFIVLRRPQSLISCILMHLAGIKDIVAFEVYVDQQKKVLGTTGLYRYKKDAHEAVWLAWFSVHPDARRQGIGQALIEHTEMLARRTGVSRIRLYTSTDPSEAAAQKLYEKNGFREIGRRKRRFETLLFREKVIDG